MSSVKPSAMSSATVSAFRSKLAVKKVYTAYLTQTSTNAPVPTVLEDEITSMVWARSGAGTYTLTKTGAFVENKTVPVSDIYTDAVGNVYKAVRTSADVITLTTYAAADTETAADGVLSNQYFHVEVYL